MTTKQRILIVDDEETVRRVLQNSLRKWADEYETLTAPDGFTALQMMQDAPFDLVVTDFRMPDMDGLELMAAIYADYPETRVILITAYGTGTLKREAEQLNAWRYLLKPVDINVFRRIVREALLAEEPEQQTANRAGLLVLSEEHYRQINKLLEQLKTDVGAHAIILADGNGQVIAGSGESPDFHTEEVASLLSGSMATLQAAGEALDQDQAQEAIHLAYREGVQENLYAVNIGRELLLVLVIENTLYSSKLGTTWYYARQTAVALRELFAQTKIQQATLQLDNSLDETLDNAFDDLFND